MWTDAGGGTRLCLLKTKSLSGPYYLTDTSCFASQDVVGGIRAAQRAEAAKAFYRRESLQAQTDDGS
jgi:hypothetical protein